MNPNSFLNTHAARERGPPYRGVAARALGLEAGDAVDLRSAALLHDVGHGPFSHITDLVMLDAMGKSHVDVSRDAVRSGTIRDALERHGADPSRVADLVGGDGHLLTPWAVPRLRAVRHK